MKKVMSNAGLYIWRIIKLAMLFGLIELPQLALGLPGLLRRHLVSGPFVYVATWVLFIGGYVAVVFTLYTLLQSRHPERKIVRKPKGHEVNTVIIGFVALMLAKTVIGSFMTQQTANDAQIEKLYSISINTSLMMVVMTAIAAPIVEEFVFRGFLMDYFFADSPFFAIILSGLVFGSVHSSSNLISWVMYVTMGLILAAVYNRERNLAASILVHFLNNLLPSLFMLMSSMHQFLK